MGYHPDATQTWACSYCAPPDSMAPNPTLAQLRGHHHCGLQSYGQSEQWN